MSVLYQKDLRIVSNRHVTYLFDFPIPTQAVMSVRYQKVLRIVSDHPELLLLPEGHAATRAAALGVFMGHKNPRVSRCCAAFWQRQELLCSCSLCM